MNDFDPGPGWRQVPSNEAHNRENVRVETAESVKWYIREEPVPPLPTEPGYYVDADGCAWRLDTDGKWDDTFGNPASPGLAGPRPPLERYEVRRETAQAVLDRVRKVHHSAGDLSIPARFRNELDAIAREFKVSS